jgi:hypothetical protein
MKPILSTILINLVALSMSSTAFAISPRDSFECRDYSRSEKIYFSKINDNTYRAAYYIGFGVSDRAVKVLETAVTISENSDRDVLTFSTPSSSPDFLRLSINKVVTNSVSSSNILFYQAQTEVIVNRKTYVSPLDGFECSNPFKRQD